MRVQKINIENHFFEVRKRALSPKILHNSQLLRFQFYSIFCIGVFFEKKCSIFHNLERVMGQYSCHSLSFFKSLIEFSSHFITHHFSEAININVFEMTFSPFKGVDTIKIFFSNLSILHRSIDLRLKNVCTKFQVDLSKIDGDTAIFAKGSVIRIGISRTDEKLKKRLKEVRFPEAATKRCSRHLSKWPYDSDRKSVV